MQFNGITLHGRALKIGHPNGYVVPMMVAQTLRVPAELMDKLGLAAMGALPPPLHPHLTILLYTMPILYTRTQHTHEFWPAL